MKIKTLRFVPLAVALALFSFAPSAFSSEGHGHWGYEGEGNPAHWGDLKAEYDTCKTGRSQSPIDLNWGRKADLEGLYTPYKTTSLDVLNNGHTIQVNYGAGSIMEIGGKEYNLLQFHFHSPSEHLVDGKPYDMIAHLVHKASDGSLAVIGVFLTEGQENALIQKVWDYLPTEGGGHNTVADVSLNVVNLLPKNRSYFHYSGSLTTPPCTEGVSWYVMKTPVEISAAQLKQFRAAINHNVRPAQALHGRIITQSR